tara:strand:- start:12459 stop:13301 length:843 start_codon:yes stop_codon:yes gene_type:complete
MEKFIRFKQLNVVKTGTSTSNGSASLKLIQTGANFTQTVLPNAIVWDRATNASAGGEMYIVTAVDSDTQLSLVAIGPTGAQGGGVPDATAYHIYMPELTKKIYGTTDGVAANKLVDSTENFLYQGIAVGDQVNNVTDDTVATVTAIDSATQLSLSADIMASAENYLISAIKPDDHDKLMRSQGVGLVENNALAANNSRVDITYDAASSASDLVYAYSDSGAVGVELMRNAIQDAIQASLEQDWSEPVYDFPGEYNACSSDPCTTNTTWLGGQNYFILRVQ